MGEKQSFTSNSVGMGTLSLALCILGIMFSFTYISGSYIGDKILNALNLNISRGIISIILFFIAMYFGNKYVENWGAKSGRIFSVFFIGLIILITMISRFS